MKNVLLEKIIIKNIEPVNLKKYLPIRIERMPKTINFSHHIEYKNVNGKRELVFEKIPLSEFNKIISGQFEFTPAYFIEDVPINQMYFEPVVQTLLEKMSGRLVSSDDVAIVGNSVGFGLYASRVIPKGKFIPYYGVLRDGKKMSDLNNFINDYIASSFGFNLHQNMSLRVDAMNYAACAKFANWSIDASSLSSWTDDATDVQDIAFANVKIDGIYFEHCYFTYYETTSEIQPGDQILINYDYVDYWRHHERLFHAKPYLFSLKTGDIIADSKSPVIIRYSLEALKNSGISPYKGDAPIPRSIFQNFSNMFLHFTEHAENELYDDVKKWLAEQMSDVQREEENLGYPSFDETWRDEGVVEKPRKACVDGRSRKRVMPSSHCESNDDGPEGHPVRVTAVGVSGTVSAGRSGSITSRVMRIYFGATMAKMFHEHSDSLILKYLIMRIIMLILFYIKAFQA